MKKDSLGNEILKSWKKAYITITLGKNPCYWNKKYFAYIWIEKEKMPNRCYKNSEISEWRDYETRNAAMNQVRKWLKMYNF